jgi:hypothetical protein
MFLGNQQKLMDGNPENFPPTKCPWKIRFNSIVHRIWSTYKTVHGAILDDD